MYIICHVIYRYVYIYIYVCVNIYTYIHIPYIFLSSGAGTAFTQVSINVDGQDVLVKLEFDPFAKRFKLRMPELSSKWCWAGEVDEKAELHMRSGIAVIMHPAKHSMLRLLNFIEKAPWHGDDYKINVRQHMQSLEDAPKANVDSTSTPNGKCERTRQPQLSPPKTSACSSNEGMTLDRRCVMCMENLLASEKHHTFNCGHQCHFACLQDYLSKHPKFKPELGCPLCVEEDHAEHNDDNDDDFPGDLCTLDANEIDETLETDLTEVLPPEYDNSVQPKRQRTLTQTQLDMIEERREEAMRRKRQKGITNGTLGNSGNITPQRRGALQDETQLDGTQDMPIEDDADAMMEPSASSSRTKQ